MSLKVTVCCLCDQVIRDDNASRLLNHLLSTATVAVHAAGKTGSCLAKL